MRSVAFLTLGCKLNQFESAAMAGQLEEAGFEIIDPKRPADVYIINTCTVTGKTDHRSRAAVRRAQRLNLDAVIVVAGCYCKVAPDEVEALPGVDLIIGNAEKTKIVALVRGLFGGREPFSGSQRSAIRDPRSAIRNRAPMIVRFFDYSRAFVKVQEGCDSQCAYCIIPRARGPNSSMSPDWVIKQVQKLVGAGYQEVVLCGTHLGTYGLDLAQGPTFTDMLKRILEETSVPRVRLSSIEPMEFDAELREAIVSSNRICRHLHIPLQSGCDAVLKAMNRGYSTDDYRELIDWFKAKCPGMCIGADVIVGFPAETEAQFEATLAFIRSISLSYLHVFSYSVRPGTPAARDYTTRQQVPPEEIKRRSRALRAESRAKRLRFSQALLGTTLDVLVLKRTDERTGRRLALSDNYVNVLVDADESLAGQIIPARITCVTEDAVMGEPQ